MHIDTLIRTIWHLRLKKINIMAIETVQAIVLKEKIPEEFIRSQHEQPGITTVHGTVLEVPVIDLNDPDQEKVLNLIVDASQKWGMFQILNHGIPCEVLSKLKEVGTEFFELPQEEKEVYAKPPESKSIEGYGTKLQKELQGKKTWNDHLFHKIFPASAINYRFWPKNPPSYRYVNVVYRTHLEFVLIENQMLTYFL